MDRRQAYARLIANQWTEHLLPIIPPRATLAVGSTIAESARGKVPGNRFANGTYAGMAAWETLRASPIEIRRWQAADGNIGLNCRAVRAVDIDSDNPEVVAAIRRTIMMRLDEAPWRGRQGTPRGALLFRAEKAIGGKVSLGWAEPDGRRAKMEILGFGNQIVIWGEHPSGAACGGSGRVAARSVRPHRACRCWPRVTCRW